MKKLLKSALCLMLAAAMLLMAFACAPSKKGPFTVEVSGGTYKAEVDGEFQTVGDGYEFEKGQKIQLTANTPNQSSNTKFVNWIIQKWENEEWVDIETNADREFIYTVDNDLRFVANFSALETYTITVMGGKMTGGITSNTVYEGREIRLTADVVRGKTFSNWTINGTVIGTVATNFAYTPTGSVTIVANYSDLAVYSVVVTGGSVTGGIDGGNTFYAGETVLLVPGTPPAGQGFDYWTVNGTQITGSTFVINQNSTVQAFFRVGTMLSAPTADVVRIAAAGTGSLEVDRVTSTTSDNYRVFSKPGVAALKVYVYTSVTGGEAVATFMISGLTSDPGTVAYPSEFIKKLNQDGTIDTNYTVPSGNNPGSYDWSYGGNYYMFAEDFQAFLADIVPDYSSSTRYYVAAQKIATVGSLYIDSAIGPRS